MLLLDGRLFRLRGQCHNGQQGSQQHPESAECRSHWNNPSVAMRSELQQDVPLYAGMELERDAAVGNGVARQQQIAAKISIKTENFC
jgi:hypothetical protein